MELTTEWLTAQVESKRRRWEGSREVLVCSARRFVDERGRDPMLDEIYLAMVHDAVRREQEASVEFAAANRRLAEFVKQLNGPALPFEAVQ